MYCKDCKFYKEGDIDQIFDVDDLKVIKKVIRGECTNSNLRYDYKLRNDNELIYHDSEDWSAYLYVGQLFGCVHFEEKAIGTVIYGR